MSENSDIRRQLGGMPTGHYDMTDMQFSVREVKPPKVEEEPSTVPSYDLDYDGVICARHQYQDLFDAVNKMIRQGVLR